MYTEKHVIPLFLKACPGWQKDLDNLRAKRDGEKPDLYIEICSLARYIVDSYKDGKTGEFQKLFRTLEMIIQEGNDMARELVMVGLVEDIQTLCLRDSYDSKVFKSWLGEESLVTWNYIEKLLGNENRFTGIDNPE